MRKNKTLLIAFFTVVSFITAVLFLSILHRPVVLESGFRTVMGTFARVTVVADDAKTAKKCIQTAFKEFDDVENSMSYQKNTSEINKINRYAYAEPVKVSQTTFAVIAKAVEFSKLTNGAFDITVAPLVDIWKSAADSNVLPSETELAEARAKIGCENLILDANETTVRFAVEGMKIDLGGIAKGYAIDSALDEIRKAGAVGAMVDIGGDIRLFGKPPKKKKYWHIGLQNPREEEKSILSGSYMLVLRLQNSAVATSGDYRRFNLIQGRKHSHIINTQTGQTSDGLSSVTIITQNAIKADALATAVTVLGAQKGLDLIEKIPQTEAILISSPPEYKLIKTSGADEFIKH